MNALEAIVDDAWDALERGMAQVAADLARRALSSDPALVDAYVVLAASTPVAAEAIALLKEAVSVGVNLNGAAATGETSYCRSSHVRALSNLARLQWSDPRQGSRGEAISHAKRALRLDPHDRAGNRFLLMGWLADTGDWIASRRIALRYKDEWRADVRYWLALHAFRDESSEAEDLLVRACKANPFVPGVLLGRVRRHPSPTASYAAGSIDEARLIADHAMNAWAASTGAHGWLGRMTRRRS